MPNFRVTQTKFYGGEMDNLMHGQEDAQGGTLFSSSGAVVRNWKILNTGAIRRRPGLAYIATLAGDARIKSFIFGQNQEYVFVFTDQRLDVFSVNEGLATYATSLTGQKWTAAMLPFLHVTQKADTMIVCHADMTTQRILRTGLTSFTNADFAFDNNTANNIRYQPYYKYANPGVTIDPSATSGTITLVTSAAHFVAAHVGSIFRLKHGTGTYKEVLITAVTNATTATATVRETLGSADATADWDEAAFSPAAGYPRTAKFHEARLWFGGSKLLPSHIFASKSALYFNFDVGTGLDGEAIQVPIDTEQVSEIRGLASIRHLQIFTDGSEIYVPSAEASPITPGSITFRPQTRYGLRAGVDPLPFDGATLFAQNNGKSIREFLFTDIEQAYAAPDVSLLAPHLVNTIPLQISPAMKDRCNGYIFFAAIL